MKKCLALLVCVLLCAWSAFAAEAQAEVEDSESTVRSYSHVIAKLVNDFLIEDDWRFEFDDKNGIFRFGVNIDSRMKRVSYSVLIRDDAYTSYAISPINADPEDKAMMNEITEFVCRANYGLKNGNFEVDMRDGEIRYKVHVDCEGSIPSRSIIKNSIYAPAVVFERYSPGLLDVIFKGSSAAEAIKQCENKGR